jgi:hypothetical protein
MNQHRDSISPSSQTPAMSERDLYSRSRISWRDRPVAWFDCFDPRQPEAFLAFTSMWCSMQMWFWPNQFAAANALVEREIGLLGHEEQWAVFGMTAALLKLIGLTARLSARWNAFSSGLLVSGLFMSIVFWSIVGVSRLIDFPHSVTPVALTGFAIAAAWQLAEWQPVWPGPRQ